MSFKLYTPAKPRLHRSELAVPGSSPKMFEKAYSAQKLLIINTFALQLGATLKKS